MIQASAPTRVSNTKFLLISYITATVICVMALLQLVNFEAFVNDVGQYTNHMSLPSKAIVAVFIVILEVFSLPFLLRLRLSQLARYISALFVLLLPLVWGVLIVPTLLQGKSIQNTGLLGDFLPIPLGSIAIMFDCLLLAGSVGSFIILDGPKVCRLR